MVMAFKVILLFFACCMQLVHQQYPNLVAGESVENATSSLQKSLPNNGTNIPITNYQIKNTFNVSKVLLQDINGTATKVTAEKVQSRKITSTENVPKPTEIQDISKGDTMKSTSINTNKTTPNLVEIAPSVMVDLNTLQTNKSNTTKYNSTNITVSKKIGKESISINSTISSNSTNLVNKNITAAYAPPVAKVEAVAQNGNDSLEVRSTKNTITKSNTTTTTTTAKPKPTTTTTTTTPKPKKPSITFGLGDFPHLPGEPIVNKRPESSGSKLPVPSEPVVPPNAQPSQELNNGFNYHSSRDYIVPIMTVLFTIPLAIGVVITTYRRFRDCWSTRHYRRMDFLVDGMYND